MKILTMAIFAAAVVGTTPAAAENPLDRIGEVVQVAADTESWLEQYGKKQAQKQDAGRQACGEAEKWLSKRLGASLTVRDQLAVLTVLNYCPPAVTAGLLRNEG